MFKYLSFSTGWVAENLGKVVNKKAKKAGVNSKKIMEQTWQSFIGEAELTIPVNRNEKSSIDTIALIKAKTKNAW